MAGKIPPQFLKHIKSAAKKKAKAGAKGAKPKEKKLPPWLQKKGK